MQFGMVKNSGKSWVMSTGLLELTEGVCSFSVRIRSLCRVVVEKWKSNFLQKKGKIFGLLEAPSRKMRSMCAYKWYIITSYFQLQINGEYLRLLDAKKPNRHKMQSFRFMDEIKFMPLCLRSAWQEMPWRGFARLFLSVFDVELTP